MNLQNHTRLPDAFWDKLLHAAKKGIGIEFDTTDTIAEMVTSRSNWSHGLAWDRTSMRVGCGSKKQYVTCKNRWFKLWTPIPRDVVENPFGYVMVIYKLAAHELRHVADYHIQEVNPSAATFVHYSDGRKLKWANRPHEQRAMQSEKDAMVAYKASPELQKTIDECVVMYTEFMKKYAAPKIRKVKTYPVEPIVQLTKLQHDWMYERVVFNYDEENEKDVDRETLIFQLRKGLVGYEVDLSDMVARSCFCTFLSDMRWSSEPGEARSAGRLVKQLWRRGLWVRS